MCWGARQRIDKQLSKLRFEAIVNAFVSRLVLPVFNIMFGNFLFDGDFSVRNLDAGVALRHFKSSSAFDFSMNKDFSIFHIPYILNKELPRVNSVKCAM